MGGCGVKVQHFPLTLLVVLTTLTLPCERDVVVVLMVVYVFVLQEDKSRVEVFGEYARKSRDSVFGPFLNMLNRPDTFTVNQVRCELLLLVICVYCSV